jgi:transcriptional regulator with XRE-family HTH domain
MSKKSTHKELSLGQRIRQLRRDRNWSQEEFGEKIDIHVQTIGVYEKDDTIPSALVLKKMAEVFGVTSDFLLFGETEGGAAKIKNKELLKRVEQLDRISPEGLKSLIDIMDLVIQRQQVKDLAKAS